MCEPDEEQHFEDDGSEIRLGAVTLSDEGGVLQLEAELVNNSSQGFFAYPGATLEVIAGELEVAPAYADSPEEADFDVRSEWTLYGIEACGRYALRWWLRVPDDADPGEVKLRLSTIIHIDEPVEELILPLEL
jgi:hypothetical protein